MLNFFELINPSKVKFIRKCLYLPFSCGAKKVKLRRTQKKQSYKPNK